MPTDPNARGNSLLSDILGELKKTNRLLEAQNKIVDKMERHARPTVITQQHPYLERSDGQPGHQSSDQAGDGGSTSGVQGPVPGGTPDSAR